MADAPVLGMRHSCIERLTSQITVSRHYEPHQLPLHRCRLIRLRGTQGLSGESCFNSCYGILAELCHSEYGTCYFSSNDNVSPDGTCGSDNSDRTYVRTLLGDFCSACCSRGSSSDHYGTRCQFVFGTCF